MELKLWKGFAKRRNSTKQPSDSLAEIHSIVLKSPTDIDNPTILLKGSLDQNVSYAKMMGNYYYIDSIRSVNNDLWELVLSLDELATFKTNVGNTVANIAYSSTGYDPNIIDTRMAMKTTQTVTSATASFGKFSSTGCYILTVANEKGGKTGFTSQYAMTSAELNNLVYFLMTDASLETALEKKFQSVYDCIISCFWMPMDRDEAAAHYSPENIYLGDVDTGISSKKLTYGLTGGTVACTIPWNYTDFRRHAPYSTISVYIPQYGLVSLNAADLIGASVITFDITIDASTGDCVVDILKGTTGQKLNMVHYNIGTAIPVAQTSMNIAGIATAGIGLLGSTVGTVVGAFTGGLGSVAGIAGTIASANALIQQSAMRPTSVKGTQQSRALTALGNDFIVYVYSIDTEDCDSANYIALAGRPVCRKEAVNAHSGFVQTVGASVSITGMRDEATRLNGYLNAGIYYE